MIRYSERHELELVALYAEDELSLAEIERRTGVPWRTVWNILHRRSVEMRPQGCGRTRPLPERDLVRTVWLHEQGLTYRQIGELLGLAGGGVKYRIGIARRRLGYRGVNRGPNNRPKKTVPPHVRRAAEAWARA